MVYSVWGGSPSIQIFIMNIELHRIRHKKKTIDGELYIDDTKICDTAENACHCLPEGRYQVSIIKCHQHSRKMPLICLDGSKVPKAQSSSFETLKPETLKLKCSKCKKLDTVGNNTNMPCYCPQLCPGNGVYNRTDGAILLGTYIAPGCLIRPKEAFDSLYDRIRQSAGRGHDITLVISSVSKNYLPL